MVITKQKERFQFPSVKGEETGNGRIGVKSVLDVEVSCYCSYYITEETPPPVTINLLSFLKSQKHKRKVEEIRGIEDKELRDAKKALLPAVTISGIIQGNREDENLKHNGLLQIDIDFKDNQHIANYDQLKELLSHIPNIAYCGLSVSGKGYFCIIPIAYPEKHRQHFRALQKAFKQLCINIDRSCINVSRLRGYSYDPDAYFNHQAIPLFVYEQPKERKTSNSSNLTTDDAKAVEYCIVELEAKSIDITNSYEAWFAIGCAFANTFKEDGRDYYHSVSQFHPNYSVDATDKKYDECLKGYDYKLGTFFYYCGLSNIIPPKSMKEESGEDKNACATVAQPTTLEISADDIDFIDGSTYTGHLFDDMAIVTMRLTNGGCFKTIYDSKGEPVINHPKLSSLASFYELLLRPARLNGIDCSIHHIVKTHDYANDSHHHH